MLTLKQHILILTISSIGIKMQLRPYQQAAVQDIYEAWRLGSKNILVQLATGAGKTVIFSKIMADFNLSSIAIAHRIELVSQISLTLARYGIRHNIIAQNTSIRQIVAIHMQELKRSFYDPHARIVVAGVDTLLRMPPTTPWFTQVRLVVQDEGHHPLKDNKWGRAAALFPNAVGLYPTATPCRADGKGLGRHADGIIDKLIVGPSMRDLIKMGYLTDYRIFAPPSDIDLSKVRITASGDYSPPQLRHAVHASTIMGDVVDHYLKFAKGKLGVTFAVDIDAATKIALQFKSKGIRAEVISSKTPDILRSKIMTQFRNRKILQLVNVDLLGEGVDVPAIEVISMARPTQSYGLYSQQFGRALRPMEGKTHAIIIDHVNNVLRHGLPDTPRNWTLDRRDKRSRPTVNNDIPLRTCLNPNCVAVYSRITRNCPECGFFSAPQNRLSIPEVDGDLFELDETLLMQLRGEKKRIDAPPKIPQHLHPIAQLGLAKKHNQRQIAQDRLRDYIALWAGYLKAQNISDSDIYRRFFYSFNIDIANAQILSTNDANKLQEKIQKAIDDLSNNY